MKLNTRFCLIAVLFTTCFLTINAFAETPYRVKRNDTLSGIVARSYLGSPYSKSQIMVAILAKNPSAFKDGNINLLLRGKRLRLPDDSEISQVSDAEARRIIAQHTRLFRDGISRTFATSLLDQRNQENDADREKTLAVVKKQTEKISQLEQEGERLRKQLDNLFKQKQKRDKELQELEEQIKQYSSIQEKAAIKGTPEQIAAANRKLKEKNEILQKKLIESKSELAENARSTMTLQRKLKNLKERMNQQGSKDNGSAEATDTTSAALSENASADTATATGADRAAAIESDSSTATTARDDSLSQFKSKFFWVLPLMLLLAILFLLWLIVRWFFGKHKKTAIKEEDYDKDYATLIEDYESLDYLNPENNAYQEEPLEPSIKLDVARAYLEADDNESALNILNEVMREGDQKQKQEAEEILAYIKQAAS